jgi:hypothetical protein
MGVGLPPLRGPAARTAVHRQDAQTPVDWEALLDFIGWKWQGQTPQAPYTEHPYIHLRPAFSWKAPTA